MRIKCLLKGLKGGGEENMDTDEKIKWLLRKQVWRALIGLFWLRSGKGGGVL
jgi:hypothetical protein